MTRIEGREISEAIPPAYTEWIGRQLMASLAEAIPTIPLDLAGRDHPCLPDETSAELAVGDLVAKRRGRHPQEGSGLSQREHRSARAHVALDEDGKGATLQVIRPADATTTSRLLAFGSGDDPLVAGGELLVGHFESPSVHGGTLHGIGHVVKGQT